MEFLVWVDITRCLYDEQVVEVNAKLFSAQPLRSPRIYGDLQQSNHRDAETMIMRRENRQMDQVIQPLTCR